MAVRRLLSQSGLRRLRLAAQQLHRPRRLTPLELVRHLGGVQAQVLGAAGLALNARTDGLTTRDIERARIDERSIVLTWAMRGTLHLVPAEDIGWLQPLVIARGIPNAWRRLAQEGVPTDAGERGLELVAARLEREGPLPRASLAEGLRLAGIRVEGQAMAHLMWLAAARGLACHGPQRGREPTFVLARDWLGEPQPREREAALAELALRYLGSHGPAAPADLAVWSGLPLGDARQAWRLVADRLAEVETAAGSLWSLRTRTESAPPGLVRLLPVFDEWLLGWKDRAFVATPTEWAQINRGGGWLRAVLVHDGRALATWHTVPHGGLRAIEVSSFTELTKEVTEAASAEMARIAIHLGPVA